MASAEQKAKTSASSAAETSDRDEWADHELNDQDASAVHGGNGVFGSARGGVRQRREGRQG